MKTKHLSHPSSRSFVSRAMMYCLALATWVTPLTALAQNNCSNPQMSSLSTSGSGISLEYNSLTITAQISCYLPNNYATTVTMSSSNPAVPGESFNFQGTTTQYVSVTPGQLGTPTTVTLTATVQGCTGNQCSATATPLVTPMTPNLTVAPGSIQQSTNGLTFKLSLNAVCGQPGGGQICTTYFMSGTPSGFITVGNINVNDGQQYLTISGSASACPAPPSQCPVTVSLTADDHAGGPTSSTQVTVNAGPPPIGPPSNQGKCKECNGTAGVPINLTTGNTWIQEQDYSVPGLGGGIQLVRTWNSQWRDGTNLPTSPGGTSPAIVGMFGHSWRSTYEEQLVTVDSSTIKYWRADGSAWTFSGGPGSYYVSSPPNVYATLTLDPTDSFYTLAFADGTSRIFSNQTGEQGDLISLVDRNGNTITVNYDSNGRISSVFGPGGQSNCPAPPSICFTYTDPLNVNQATSVYDSVGIIANYQYDPAGRLSIVSYPNDPEQMEYKFTYDTGASGVMITQITDQKGNTIESHLYDDFDRAITSSRGSQNADLITLQYNYPSNGQTTLTDSLNDPLTQYGYTSYGQHNFVTSIAGTGCASCGGRGNTTLTYDPSGNGNITSSTDANNVTTNFTYDNYGNVKTRTVQLSSSDPCHPSASIEWQYNYNQFQEILSAIDPLGQETDYGYDTHGNLLTITTPSPDGGTTQRSVTTFGYDPAGTGELFSITDPKSNPPTTISYCQTGQANCPILGLVASIKDDQNNTTSFQYDGRGNRTLVTDALGDQVQYAYDPMSRLTSIQPIVPTQYNSTTFGYDERGRRIQVTDADSKSTTYGYDDADRLTSVVDAQTPPDTTSYSYDTENNLSTITDAKSNATTFNYDAMGHVTKVIFPLFPAPQGPFETYVYDSMENLKSKTDRNGKTINYNYDNLYRLTEKDYPDSTSVKYCYDNDSRLTSATDPSGTYSFTYDDMGRLTGTTVNYSFISRTLTTAYKYDLDSNRIELDDPEGGKTTYNYDTLNRLQTLTDFNNNPFGFTYDALSRRKTLTRPTGGLITNYSYDSISRLLSVLHQTSAQVTVDGTAYGYDPLGTPNRTSMTNENPASGVTSNYTYDNIYELKNVTQGVTTTESYSYDAVGNRLSTLTSSNWQYNAANEVTSTPTETFQYDSNGNLLQDTPTGQQTTYYTWDYENRLTQEQKGSATSTFKYDPFGRRIEENAPNGQMQWIYVYDGDNVFERLDLTGVSQRKFTMGLGIDEPLATYQAITSGFYEQDGLGSVTSISNNTGALQASYTYDSFGNVTGMTGPRATQFLFTGREYDSPNQYYYRARYYNPVLGRFISEDQTRWAGSGPNFYRYALDNPINLRDPSGLEIIVEGDTGSYATALGYLRTSPSMAKIANDLIQSPEVHIIKTNDDCRDDYDSSTKTIDWDPHCGLICTSGGRQSGALGLGHEMAHADGGFVGALMGIIPDMLLKLFPDGPYDNFEERRVITGPETSAAKDLGEATRTDHRGANDPGLPSPISH